MSSHHKSTFCSTRDMISIDYFHKEDSGKKAIQSFFKMYLYGLSDVFPGLENIHSTDESISSIIVICNDASLQHNVDKTLEKLQGHQLRMMVIICPEDKCPRYPEFNLNSKIKFWTYLTCRQFDFECVPCSENELAKCIFDCFREMIGIKLNSASGSNVTAKAESTNIISAIADKIVQKSTFKDYIEKALGASLRWIDENSHYAPDLAVCLNRDKVESSIQQLQENSGKNTILIVINSCAEGVPIETSRTRNNTFSNVIDLRFRELGDTFYGNESAVKQLMKLLSGKFYENTEGNVEKNQKQRRQTPLSTSMETSEPWTMVEHESCEEEWRWKSQRKNPSFKQRTNGNHKLQFLCNTKENEIRKIINLFRDLYSLPFDIIWKTSASDFDLEKNIFIVCLKISRLEDDIAHTISSVQLSDTVKPVLIILHYCAKGVQLDTPLQTPDARFKDVINILYSDESGCYKCSENGNALEKMKYWLEQSN